MRRNTLALAVTLAGVGIFIFVVFPVQRVVVDVDGQELEVATRKLDEGRALALADVELNPEDAVALEEETGGGQRVVVQRAVPVYVTSDERTVTLRTQADTVQEVLQEAGVEVEPGDTVLVNGQPVRPNAPLDELTGAVGDQSLALASYTSEAVTPVPAVQVEVREPIPVRIFIDGVSQEVMTSRLYVEEVLAGAGISLGPEDIVEPALESLVGEGVAIHVYRSKTVFVTVGGEPTVVNTYRTQVFELLRDMGVAVSPEDLVDPGLSTPLFSGASVSVTRITGETVVIDEAIPFETVYRSDPDLEAGKTVVMQEGRPGVRHHEVKISFVNGEEAGREVLREWVDPEPQDEVVALGTKEPVLTYRSPDGPIPYVQSLVVSATWYNATCAGCGNYTATGERLRYGIVAVDPEVIPLHTCMYIPDYGYGKAEDTGGAITGNMIDLGFPGDADGSWWGTREVEIYILASCPEGFPPP